MKSIALLSFAFPLVSCFPDLDDPKVKKQLGEAFNSMAEYEADRVICAIEMYRLRYGNYPDSLAQLSTVGAFPLNSGQFSYATTDSTYVLNQLEDTRLKGAGFGGSRVLLPDWYWSGLGCSQSNMMPPRDSAALKVPRD